MNSLKKTLLAGGNAAAVLSAAQRLASELAVPYPKTGYTTNEMIAAYDRLMNGPRASRPTSRAVRKVIGRMRAGLDTEGSWRSWPSRRKINHEEGVA